MASQEDKPFSCSVPGCGQCFANSDHLAVHLQKHELSLKFGSRQEVVMDQTPTPTRFLKNIEESGLFDELQTNPFDQDFKQAAQASRAKGLAGGLSPSTPIRIQLPGSNFTLTVPGILASHLATSQALAAASQQQQQLSSQENSDTGQDDSSQDSLADASNQPPKIPVAPPPSIANPDKEIPKATPPANSNASSSVKQRLREALQKKTSTISPYGYKTPYITIPATPEILQQALSTVLPASGLTGTTYTATPPVAHTVTMETDDGDTEKDSGEPVTRRRRKYSDTPPEEPEEKRQKFLERNRAAAMRCRQKKKVWVENLEKKAKDLEQTNNQLQNEVNYLRNEVHQLKTILLAHKDCPLIISQQQQIARVIQQLGSVVTPANTTVEAATKLATSQAEVNFTSLNGPQSSEDNSTTQQQLERLVYAATVTAEAAGKTEQ